MAAPSDQKDGKQKKTAMPRKTNAAQAPWQPQAKAGISNILKQTIERAIVEQRNRMKRKPGTKMLKKKGRSPERLQGQTSKAGKKQRAPREVAAAAGEKALVEAEVKLFGSESFSHLKRSKTPTCSPQFRRSAVMESNQEAW